MKKKVYITNHANNRIKERSSYNNTDKVNNVNAAFKHGYESNNFKDPFKKFLEEINSGNGKFVAKVFKDYIYIFNNNHGHRLVTMYPVQEEYLPVENYLINKEELNSCIIVLENKNVENDFKYWSENGLTADMDEAIIFKNQISANNYIDNNITLQDLLGDYIVHLL